MTAVVLETPEQVGAALAEAAGRAFEVATERGHTRAVHDWSLSGLGACRRQCAYRVAGTTPSDLPRPDQARAANLGSWQHDGLLPLLAEVLPGEARVEQDVTLLAAGLALPGRYDLWWRSGGVLVDLKTVREFRLSTVDKNGVYDNHRVQVLGYALAVSQRLPEPVRWVAWLYLDRATGEERIIVEPFTPDAALEVIDRVAQVVRIARRYGPDTAPRDERGPGLSLACDGCPWLRRCWGDDAVPGGTGAQRVLVHDDASAEAALRLYAEAQHTESGAKKDKDFAKAILSGLAEGTYGGWTLGWGRPGRQLDQKEAARVLTEHGLPVPVKTRQPSISVRPAKPVTLPRKVTRKGRRP